MEKVSHEDYIDPMYRRLMNSKRGQKLVQVLRVVAMGMKTIEEINDETGYTRSEIRELISKGLKAGYIEVWRTTKCVPGNRGRPVAAKREEDTGRPANLYSITAEAKWLIRFDPFTGPKWNQVERVYERLLPLDVWDSYANFRYAIQANPLLRKFQKSDEFMINEFRQTIFKLFVFFTQWRIENVEQLYDELIKTFAETVRPEDMVDYYSALERCLPQLQSSVDHCKLILNKMQTVPKIREYLGY
jgi:hypothetical protein